MSMKRDEFDANVAPATNIPHNLYHYCSFKWIENILACNKLYFQSPSDVNDLFDCELHPRYGEHHGKRGEDHAASHSAWEAGILKGFGLFCLSEVKDDILMWSHYGDKHRGVVLEFDGNRLFNNFENRRDLKSLGLLHIMKIGLKLMIIIKFGIRHTDAQIRRMRKLVTSWYFYEKRCTGAMSVNGGLFLKKMDIRISILGYSLVLSWGAKWMTLIVRRSENT